MFTGIISDIGEITAVENKGDTRFTIATHYDLTNTTVGASIACDGVCLTVIEKTENAFLVDVSAETLSRTNLSNWHIGTKINLEQALKLGDELGGHMVTGHVDGIAELMNITPDQDSHKLMLKAPKTLQYHIAEKGSVTLNGVSLTVNEVSDNTFTVNIIPHTWQVTTFGNLTAGDQLHLEIDVIARYLSRLMEVRA
jgi:riboflavin synthase